MNIKIHLPDSLYAITKDKRFYEVNGKTVGECLNHLVYLAPVLKKALFYDTGNSLEGGGLLPTVEVLVVGIDGESATMESLAKEVRDGDQIFIKTNVR